MKIDWDIFIALFTSSLHLQLVSLTIMLCYEVEIAMRCWRDMIDWDTIPVWNKLTDLQLCSAPMLSLRSLFQKTPLLHDITLYLQLLGEEMRYLC
jgi:hypothetical protein